jgi:FixJ family two-component response regulator
MLARIQGEDSAMTTMMHRSPVTPKFTDGITAINDPLTHERIKRSGVVKRLRKPFEEQELPDAIHRVG